MKLVKFCKNTYNLFECDNLLIGSYNKYRNTENQKIKDEHEARFSVKLSIPEPKTVPSAWISAITNGAIGFTGNNIFPNPILDYDIEIGGLSTKEFVDGMVTLTGGFNCNYSITHSYIFCMSSYSYEQTPPDPEYDSAWFLSGKESINKFKEEISKSILEKLSIELSKNKNDYIRRFAPNLKIKTRSGFIEYTAKDTHIINENDINDLNLIKNLVDEAPFRKRPAFSKENEYRFVFDVEGIPRGAYKFSDEILIESVNLRKYSLRYILT